eukprot:3142494-Prymnesium_polylepis.2
MSSRSLRRSDALAHLAGHDHYHVQSRETRSYRFEPALTWMDGGQQTASETARWSWAGAAAMSIWHGRGT